MSSASVTDKDRPPMVLSAQPSQPLTPQGSFPDFASFFFSSSPVFALLALARALKPLPSGHVPSSIRSSSTSVSLMMRTKPRSVTSETFAMRQISDWVRGVSEVCEAW